MDHPTQKQDWYCSGICIQNYFVKQSETNIPTEFKNSVLQQFLKDNGIKFFTIKSEKKASIVERFNRTLKTKMWKYFTTKSTVHYLDVLPELVSSYTSTYHRSIKMAPKQVSLLSIGLVRRNFYENVKSKVKFKFCVEDRVRISKSRRTFKKGYLPNWTEEIFTICKESPKSTQSTS